jgi:hypothetical protein
MEWILVALFIAFALYALRTAALALRTGTAIWGRATYHRARQPAEFWFASLHPAATLPVLAVVSWEFAGHGGGGVPSPGSRSMAMFFTATIGFWLIRYLQTGTASLGTLDFSRVEEPREYWLLILTFAAAFTWLAWAAAGYPGD